MRAHRVRHAAIVSAIVLGAASTARATDIIGTVQLQGTLTFAAPIPGIALDDLQVTPQTETESTGNGEQCEVQAVTTDTADVGGAYPDAGSVSVTLKLSHGGPMVPSGDCLVTLQVRGTDGVSVSARGSRTLFLTAAQIMAGATVVVPTITVRQSKAIAGLTPDCLTWVKKQLKSRTKCDVLLLKLGPAGAAKCKDAGPEPAGCDPGNFVEAILALAHGGNDQQTSPGTAQGVDAVMLKDQIKCEKQFGKAAVNFANKRTKLTQKKCIAALLDSQSCRNMRTNDAKKKLDKIDTCTVNQVIDGGTGRAVPQVGSPCAVCIDGGGNIDRKCLKACFQLTVADFSDGILGDLPVCGDGILQPGEFCDDGNTVGGDCCSATCTVEAGSAEGPIGDPTCSDTLDNDCDGLVDGADPNCQ